MPAAIKARSNTGQLAGFIINPGRGRTAEPITQTIGSTFHQLRSIGQRFTIGLTGRNCLQTFERFPHGLQLSQGKRLESRLFRVQCAFGHRMRRIPIALTSQESAALEWMRYASPADLPKQLIPLKHLARHIQIKSMGTADFAALQRAHIASQNGSSEVSETPPP